MLLPFWLFWWDTVEIPHVLWLHFEDPPYVVGDLDGQDWWEETQSASGFNMEVIDDTEKVIYQAQSLAINIPASTSGVNIYKRAIVPMRESVTTWSMTVDNDNPNPSFQIGWYGAGMVMITLIKFYANGMIFIQDNNLGGTVIGPYTLHDDEHTFSLSIAANGSTTLLRDATEIYTGQAAHYQFPDTTTNWLTLEGENIGGVVPTQFIVDDFKEFEPEALFQLSPPENVFAIKRENYVLVSWDRVKTFTDGTPINGQIARYEVWRFNSANEFNPTLVKTIRTTDTASHIDTIFRDTTPGTIYGYQIYAFLNVGAYPVHSVSETAIMHKVLSEIDSRTEIIDQQLLRLGTGVLDQDILG